MKQDDDNGLRVDLWLFYTRFYKTRKKAVAAVSGGHVRINGERGKPSSRVKPGDVIELLRDQLPFTLKAGPLPARRGPASEARACFTEGEDSMERRRDIVAGIRQDRRQMPTTAGRPDKHTRRKVREHNRQRGESAGES